MSQPLGSTKYESIRRYLEQIYLYGFLSREDWIAFGTVKDYDKMLTLLRDLYPELDADAFWQDRRKYLRFQRSYVGSLENRMVGSYYLHTLDSDALCMLLQILSRMKSPQTLRTLTSYLETQSASEDSDLYHTVRRRVLELEAYGYVVNAGKTIGGAPGKKYSLRTDALEKLNVKELRELYAFVQYAAGAAYPCVAGSFLKHSIGRRVGQSDCPLPILLRHYNKRSVFDEDALYHILSAIHGRGWLRVSCASQKSVKLLPIAVRYDRRLGRWYLLCMDKQPRMHRISSLKQIAVLRDVEDAASWDKAAREVRSAFSASLFSGEASHGGTVVVEAELRFGDAAGMLEQFRREIRIGEIVTRGDKLYYQAAVSDPLSLVPFLRSFSPWLRICPGEHGLAEKLREDLLLCRRSLERV